MIIAIDQDQYNKDYILFSEKTKNNILNNGNFYRIFYSPSSFSMNGVHLYFDLQNIHQHVEQGNGVARKRIFPGGTVRRQSALLPVLPKAVQCKAAADHRKSAAVRV